MAKNRRKPAPGFMLFTDDLNMLCDDLTGDEILKLLRAARDYFLHGKETDFEDRLLRKLWAQFRGSINRSCENYLERVNANRYAAYKRDHRKDKDCLSREEWDEKYAETEVLTDDSITGHHVMSCAANITITNPIVTQPSVNDRIGSTDTEPAAKPSDNPDDYTKEERDAAMRKARRDFLQRGGVS